MGRLLCELEFSSFGCRAGDGEGLDRLVILVNFMNLQILLQHISHKQCLRAPFLHTLSVSVLVFVVV